jgi:beta-glucosidase
MNLGLDGDAALVTPGSSGLGLASAEALAAAGADVAVCVSGGPSTAFPVSISQISTWDGSLVESFGKALGLEAKAKDQGGIYASAFNIMRVPLGGRTFEYFGEDPYLAGRSAVSAIDGIQSTGTVAIAKRFVANNHDANRMTVSAAVDA